MVTNKGILTGRVMSSSKGNYGNGKRMCKAQIHGIWYMVMSSSKGNYSNGKRMCKAQIHGIN
jgi:hypothetical protein